MYRLAGLLPLWGAIPHRLRRAVSWGLVIGAYSLEVYGERPESKRHQRGRWRKPMR